MATELDARVAEFRERPLEGVYRYLWIDSTEAWTGCLRGLVARGLTGVELVISDAHGGIKAAIAQVLSGASWQRCRTHFMANLATKAPHPCLSGWGEAPV